MAALPTLPVYSRGVFFVSLKKNMKKLCTQGKIEIKLNLKFEDSATNPSVRLVVDAYYRRYAVFHQMVPGLYTPWPHRSE